jgi:hypothetical protein
MIRSQHKEGRQRDTTGEPRFQKTEPISEGLTPQGDIRVPAHKAPENSGLTNFHADYNRASKPGCSHQDAATGNIAGRVPEEVGWY